MSYQTDDLDDDTAITDSNFTYYSNGDIDNLDTTYIPALGITMVSLGVILNLISICTIIRGEETSKQMKIQMVNLAVADLLACVAPAYIALGWTGKTYVASCQIMSIIGNGAFYAGLLWNMVISMERFVIVYFPFRAQRYTRKHKIIVAVCVWTICLVSVIKYIRYESADCDTSMTFNPHMWLEVIQYSVPALVITASYLLIGLKLCRKSNIGESDRIDQAHEFTKRNQVSLFTYLYNFVCLKKMRQKHYGIEQIVCHYNCAR